MASKALPSPEVLRQLLRYEPDTGKLFWLPRPVEMFPDTGKGGSQAHFHRFNRNFPGRQVRARISKDGYESGTLLGRPYLAHRVIWAIVTGEWPPIQIDHINGNPSDNRWVNLRLATIAQNAQNRKTPVTNTSGFRGVTFNRKVGKWQASICVRRKKIYLGVFDEKERAADAYVAASQKYHGEYGRTA